MLQFSLGIYSGKMNKTETVDLNVQTFEAINGVTPYSADLVPVECVPIADKPRKRTHSFKTSESKKRHKTKIPISVLALAVERFEKANHDLVDGLESAFGPMTGLMDEYKTITQEVVDGKYDNVSNTAIRLKSISSKLRAAIYTLTGSEPKRHGRILKEWISASDHIIHIMHRV